jgi:hypothetical protein
MKKTGKEDVQDDKIPSVLVNYDVARVITKYVFLCYSEADPSVVLSVLFNSYTRRRKDFGARALGGNRSKP